VVVVFGLSGKEGLFVICLLSHCVLLRFPRRRRIGDRPCGFKSAEPEYGGLAKTNFYHHFPQGVAMGMGVLHWFGWVCCFFVVGVCYVFLV